jgi:hypothetical protein
MMDEETLKRIKELIENKKIRFLSEFEDIPAPTKRFLIWTSSHDRFVYYCNKQSLFPTQAFRLTWERTLGLEGDSWQVIVLDDFVQIEMQMGTSRFLDLAYVLITRGFAFEEGVKDSLSQYRDFRIKELQEQAEEEERRNRKLYRKPDRY